MIFNNIFYTQHKGKLLRIGFGETRIIGDSKIVIRCSIYYI